MVRTMQPLPRRNRFAECGAGLWVQMRDDHQDIRLVANCCHDRFCIPCGNARAAVLLGNLRRKVADLRPLFVTFTLRHSPTPLKDQIDRLFRSFLALRRRAFFKDRVRGGAAFLELKISSKDGLWHPHLHILADGSFLPHADLAAEWHAITGDSSIVDVRRPPDVAQVASYVTKYVTKPADSTVFDHPDKLDEMIIALKGRHLVECFGTWRGLKLLKPEHDGHAWVQKAPLERLIQAALHGDPQSRSLLEAVIRKYPSVGEIRPPPE